MIHTCRRSLFAIALAAPLAFAQTDQPPEMEEDEPFPIQTATCDDIYESVRGGNPG